MLYIDIYVDDDYRCLYMMMLMILLVMVKMIQKMSMMMRDTR